MKASRRTSEQANLGTPLLGYSEVAARLRIGLRTCNHWVAEGILPAPWRFSRSGSACPEGTAFSQLSAGQNGEGGIRTHGTGLSPPSGFQDRRLQPLGHLSNGSGSDRSRRRHPPTHAVARPRGARPSHPADPTGSPPSYPNLSANRQGVKNTARRRQRRLRLPGAGATARAGPQLVRGR